MVQTRYCLQYCTMRLSGYINAQKDPALLALWHGMEYLMNHPHEPILYSRNNISKLNAILLKYFLKSIKDYIKQSQQYSNFIHMYCDAYHKRDLNDKRDQSHIIITSSMAPSPPHVSRNKPKICGSVPKLRQEQFIQVWWIKTGLESFVGLLDIHLALRQN